MTINYVIACYNGTGKRKHKFPKPSNILNKHLKQLIKLEHNLDQVTIMKVQAEKNLHKKYYEIDETVELLQQKCKVKIIDCENKGYSGGQFFYSYENDKSFDHYIFIEDDYCPNFDNFDKFILNKYNEKFPDSAGLLCSLVQGKKNDVNSLSIHWEGIAMVNNKSLQMIYKKFPDPRTTMTKYIFDDNPKNMHFIKRRGAYLQLVFSQLFNLCNIEHKSYLENDERFIYWEDIIGNRDGFMTKSNREGYMWSYDKNDVRINEFTLDIIRKNPFVPIQICCDYGIGFYTNLLDL